MKLSMRWMVLNLLLVFIIATWPARLYSQYGNVWVFGDSVGINFNTAAPTLFKTSISTNEGSASICDVQGNLLFYTDGTTIWDRSHQPMPNGTDLPGVGRNITSSTSQGALIVPIPGKPSEYYVFSLGSLESRLSGRLYYCIVDMKRNNGMGDVIAERKSKLLADDLTEQMTAISGSHCDIWLVVASWTKPEIRVYNISFEGLDTVPVISNKIMGGGVYGGVIGTIDASPDRSKIAFSHGNVVLYDFNPTNGVASNPLVLEKKVTPNFYGVCFSPDNSKVYASAEGGDGGIFQFNLSLNDTHSIIKSKRQLSNNTSFALKRALDGKIYIAAPGRALSVINRPNLAGLACDYKGNEFVLNGRSIIGLPNVATIVVNKKNYTSRRDSIICADTSVLMARVLDGLNYQWQDGSLGKNFTTDTSGTYWVTYQDFGTECVDYVDTFHLFIHKNTRIYSTIVLDALCKADTFLIQAKITNATDYLWGNQSPGPENIVREAGIYWVNYRRDSVCEVYSDTFDVRYPLKDFELSLSIDTLYCAGTLINFQNTSDPPFNRFQWHYGDGKGNTVHSPQHSYSQAGRYEVQLLAWIDDKCADSVVKYVTVDSVFPVRFRADKETICQGEMIRFFPEVDANVTALYWNYGMGEHLVSADKLSTQHAFAQQGIYPITLTAINRICPETKFTDTIEVQALPAVYLGPDRSLCWQGQPILLKNNATLSAGTYHYLWNTGATTASIQALHHGTYWLRVITDSLGCTNTETIDIEKDCYVNVPNAFTPNGDGVNDYFFPRQLLSKSVTHFHLQVYNRWGQVVFETSSWNGRGWDGYFNGSVQPQGVYVYRLEMHLQGRGIANYEGNVTLIR